MPRIIKVLAYVLGASWFLPVSCTIGLLATVPIISTLDERQLDDKDYALFYVVWQPGEAGKPFEYALLKDLSLNQSSSRSYMMEQHNGFIDINAFTRISYQLLASNSSEQMIEVVYRDDDKSSSSRYRATRSEIRPVSSRMMKPDYLFKALPITLIFAFLIYGLGKWMRRLC